MTARLDLTGEKSGKLTAIKPHGSDKRGSALWLCRCDCGNESIVLASNFKKGQSKSCGCSRFEVKHGHAIKNDETSTYQTWLHMRQRCLNPCNDSYHNYGGRGISICSEWESFEQFLKDMGERPHGLTIDRIDNSKGYFKENCRWTDKKTQLRNKRNNRLVMWEGREVVLSELCERYAIGHQVVTSRLRLGWSIENALMRPLRGK